MPLRDVRWLANNPEIPTCFFWGPIFGSIRNGGFFCLGLKKKCICLSWCGTPAWPLLCGQNDDFIFFKLCLSDKTEFRRSYYRILTYFAASSSIQWCFILLLLPVWNVNYWYSKITLSACEHQSHSLLSPSDLWVSITVMVEHFSFRKSSSLRSEKVYLLLFSVFILTPMKCFTEFV